RLTLHTGADTHIEEYTVDQDWRPLAFSKTGGFAASELVFAGYGIVAPAADGFGEYDSYTHLEVKDKWVMVFRYLPESIAPELRNTSIATPICATRRWWPVTVVRAV